MSTQKLIAFGAAAGLGLLIAAVWVSGASTSASLGVTALLVLIAVTILAGAARSGPDNPIEADADQRERMRREIP